MTHRLDPLLRPRSVAVIGASVREDSMGDWVLRNLERSGFDGNVYPVNPGYDEVRGRECFSSISDLPEAPDLAIFAIGDHRLEASVDEAIAKGVRAAVIHSSLFLDVDTEPPLKERLRQKLAEAGMLVCGGNGMGFYNIRDNVWACGFDSRKHPPGGNAAIISQSGSGMCGIIDMESRLRANLAVSTGSELTVTMDEYIDFALDLPETKVIGLFIETARHPPGFRAALERASRNKIPIVAIKVGRTKKSAEMAISHSGMIAGDDATYNALFDRYGVHRVTDMDEMATALILFAELGPIGSGGLVSLHDSGGEQQLMVDLALEAGVPLTELSAATTAKLDSVLPPELPAVNPLDAWSRGGEDWAEHMTRCLSIMIQDEGAAIGGLIHDRGPDGLIYRAYTGYLKEVRKVSNKPIALVGSLQGPAGDKLAIESTWKGMPVLDGVLNFLKGVRGLMDYRDFQALPEMAPLAPPGEVVSTWRARLVSGEPMGEAEAMQMLRDFDILASNSVTACSLADVLMVAGTTGYPLALKTAASGIAHKTESQGVCLDVVDEVALTSAYRDLENRLGPEVIVAPMADSGIELILGARRDPQFGPLVIIGMGGLLAETVQDVQFALPPFDAAWARRLVDRLRFRKLLDGVRGAPASDIDGFCEMAERFSAMVHALGEVLHEIDLNPVIVTSNQCIAVDALVVGSQREA